MSTTSDDPQLSIQVQQEPIQTGTEYSGDSETPVISMKSKIVITSQNNATIKLTRIVLNNRSNELGCDVPAAALEKAASMGIQSNVLKMGNTYTVDPVWMCR